MPVYTDMLAQRGMVRGAVAGAVATKPRAVVAAPRAPNAERSRRMTFKDKHALETLPGRIAALEAEIAGVTQVLADTDLYARRPERFAQASQALEHAQRGLAAAEEQWLELEMLRETLEG